MRRFVTATTARFVRAFFMPRRKSRVNKSQQCARWLAESHAAVAFTGAGISTESGIPDFRSPGGIWSNVQPVYYDEFLVSGAARYEYWRQKSLMHREFADSQPNDGHRVLAAWEAAGRLQGVVTQNIDGLHQLAGSQHVVELHGTAREVSCLDCHERFDTNEMVARFFEHDRVPECPACGAGRLKHATISFGQPLDSRTIDEAMRLASESDLMLAMGSSLVVYPAAAIPQLAKESGARLVIINREPTPLDGIADLVLHGGIGETLLEIARHLDGEIARR